MKELRCYRLIGAEIPNPNFRKPQKVLREKLNNGCLADEFPHEYGCLCQECNEIWEALLLISKIQEIN